MHAKPPFVGRAGVVGLALMLSALGGGTAGAQAPRRRALVVGIDLYVPAGTTPGDGRRWTNLQGAANDADEFRRLLLDRFGFQPGEIKLLRDREATRDAIMRGLDQWLLADAGKGDTRVFFFAGHGSQVRNSKS